MSRHEVGPRLAAALGGTLLLAACGSGASCVTHPVAASCPDLLVEGRAYDEWRSVTPPATLQEISDATYPACNHSDRCGGDPLDGLGSTDVWRLEGVPPARAVLALREGTDTYVVFVRRGTDPRTLQPLLRRALRPAATPSS
jgi:hypothetical protein